MEHSEVSWAYAIIYDELHACGCGNFTSRLELVRQVLRDCPLYEGDSWQKYSEPAAEWLLCVLTDADLIEHGTSIGGSWLTDKGRRFLTILENEKDWEGLLGDNSVGYCECLECDRKK